MSRLLTDKEIHNILDFIKPNTKLPPETAKSIVNNHKNRLVKQLKNQKIYPELIPELKKQLEMNYIKSLISPGESIGILAAQSIGEKQTQNSIDYDEEIIVKYYGEIKRMKIGVFIDEYINILGSIKIDDYSEIQQCENIYIQSITDDEKIEWKEISEVSRHAPKGNLIKVTTESGRSVVSTLSHSHLKKDKRKVVPVLGSELKLGDRIPVIRNSFLTPECNTKKIDITCYIKYDRIGVYEYDSNGSTPSNSPTNKNNEEYVFVCRERFRKFIVIDNTFIEFLGLFIANGIFRNHFHRDEITLYSKDRYDPQIYEMIETLCTKYELEFNCIQSGLYFFQSFKDNRTTEYNIRSKIFTKFLVSLIMKDKEKRVPDFIFGLDKDIIQLFLFSYFKDGGFNCNCNSVNKDIQFLLTYFGIYSRIVGDKLVIPYDYKELFYDEFGIEINKNNLEDTFHTLDDPELNEEVIRLSKSLYKTEEQIKINTYEELDNFLADYVTEINKDNIGDIPENIKYLSQVQNADIVWEKIVKMELIEEKDYKHPYVYDFTVPGTESFGLFSGIVVHNTLNT